MRFTKPFYEKIATGQITVAFRRWTFPRVKVGRVYRTGGGRVKVLAVDAIEMSDIQSSDLSKAGYNSLEEVLVNLVEGQDRNLYRIRFELSTEPDPRDVLAEMDCLDPAHRADISARLRRLDKASSHGAWTLQTLRLIADHPGRRAPDLAAMLSRDKNPFKTDVRKLKNLGLTKSLPVGYELSARGRSYLSEIQ